MPLTSTQVAIVGAGPAGLLLSHLLAERGIDSIVFDRRTREEIESTIRAGILEQGTVDVLSALPHSRVLTDGHRHDGIELRFSGEGHRIDFPSLVGRSVWLYPQHEVLKDLITARLAAGQDIRFSHEVSAVDGIDGERPTVRAHAVDADGAAVPGSEIELSSHFVVGADGSRSTVRQAVADRETNRYREYPFAWFGVLCEAPPSADELIYSNSDAGFALISQRSETVQRMYFQCDPGTDPDGWSEEELWATLQERVPGTTLREGPIFQRDVLRFRSFVAGRLRRGRAAIIGDAAHTVPPTGAKGMNLAIADVLLLADALGDLIIKGDERGIDAFADTALRRIWKAQHFSWWMTSMLHRTPDDGDFDRERQLGELRSVIESEAGSTYLAEAYTGWPFTR